jgi:DNA-binding CsgD family transcriptional regulator
MLPAVRRGRPPYPDVLTPREWEVLSLIRDGLTNPQIAQRLSITESGARFHVSEILSKLGVSSRHQAVQWSEVAQAQRRWGFSAFRLLLRHLKGVTIVQMARAAGAALLVTAGVAFVLLALGVLTNDRRSVSPPTERIGSQLPTPEIDPNQPTAYGPYRLLPPGFPRASVPYQDQMPPWPVGQANASFEEFRRSPLFVDVKGVPDDIPFLDMHSVDATSGLLILQEFRTPDGQRSVIVIRRWVTRLPIDVNLPLPGGTLLMSKERVLNVEALVLRRSPNSPIPVPYTHVRLVEGRIETVVEGTNVPADLVIQVAENALRSSRGE